MRFLKNEVLGEKRFLKTEISGERDFRRYKKDGNRNMEKIWDEKLNIQTAGRDDSFEDAHHNPYEPTPYSVLERLAESGYLTAENVLVDYGCGKGRTGIYLSEVVGCRSIGIEFDENMFAAAERNGSQCPHSERVQFLHMGAENYAVDEAADSFYFFNPFSVPVLQTVLGKVRESYYQNPREIYLFFYYPFDEYIAWLMTADGLEFVDEIECMDLFPGDDERERVLIFEMV